MARSAPSSDLSAREAPATGDCELPVDASSSTGRDDGSPRVRPWEGTPGPADSPQPEKGAEKVEVVQPREGLRRRKKLRKVLDSESGADDARDATDTSATSSEEVASDCYGSPLAQAVPEDSLAMQSGAPSQSALGRCLAALPTASLSSEGVLPARWPRPVQSLGDASGLQRADGQSAGIGNACAGASLSAGVVPSAPRSVGTRRSALSSGTVGGLGPLGPSSVVPSLWRGLPSEGGASARGRASVRFTPNLNRVLASPEPSARLSQEKASDSGKKDTKRSAGPGDSSHRLVPGDGFAWTGMILSSQKHQEAVALREKKNAAGQGSASRPALGEQTCKIRPDAPAKDARGQRPGSARDGKGLWAESASSSGRVAAGVSLSAPTKNDVGRERLAGAQGPPDSGGDSPRAVSRPALKRDAPRDGKGTHDDGIVDGRRCWKREFGEELAWGMRASATDGSYLPMSLPFNQKSFPRRSAAAALMAADASGHFLGEPGDSACAESPGFASFMLLQLPRVLPPLDKDAMRRQQVRDRTPQTQALGPVPGVASGAGEKAGTAPAPRAAAFADDPVTLSELPEGAIGRLLVHNSGRVVWCLGGPPEPAEETKKRRRRQRRDFPTCPWEAQVCAEEKAGKGEAKGKGSSSVERRKKEKQTETRRTNGHAMLSGAGLEGTGASKQGVAASDTEGRRARLRRGSVSDNSDNSEGGPEEGLPGSAEAPIVGPGKPEGKGGRRVRRIESSDEEDCKAEKERTAAGSAARGRRESSGGKVDARQVKKEFGEANAILSADGAPGSDAAAPGEVDSETTKSSSLPACAGVRRGDDRRTRARNGSPAEARGSYYFKIDVGCDCIFKQECAVMLKDTREFVFLVAPNGSSSRRTWRNCFSRPRPTTLGVRIAAKSRRRSL
ncbi:conserved hypothetical protein [Neospora caninum Liverpool]|uniref:Uncharacterized protein n=1 Tax=Neospora caninum (strain Liverpool) TaxID=572307 RepID=F0VPN1_NEOCL|nr:conserved hypothetical protein [Neospora caninum Liverpool]CBZ55678.1 conserved hypothetical protein [Neospora caninum Liverpool]CEL70420.1 TPA: hypothetical protein BN1204_061020 [Neospora caninum Liverpool]|eukprot:XP_003885704.1 conserved hypothetical protein [Neospora caninum Liverpool]